MAGTATVPEIEAPQSMQGAQFDQWVKNVTGVIEKHGAKFTTLPEELQKQFRGELTAEIAKLSNKVEDEASFARRRVQTLLSHYQGGGAYNGPGSIEDARRMGAAAMLAIARSTDELTAARAIVEKADFDPSTGPSGGLIMPETIFAGIANRLPQYGVFEADCPSQPCNHGGRLITWNDSFVVYFPGIGESPTLSSGSFGGKMVNLGRWAVLTRADRFMLQEALLVPLGQLILEGMSRALAAKTDLCGLHGDGTDTYKRITGLFNFGTDSAVYVVTGDSGDDTFAEVCDKAFNYVLTMIGKLPAEYDDGNAKFYGHRTIFFRFLGARDSNGKPYGDINLLDPVNRFVLYGYPYRFDNYAPALSDTAVSTIFLALANLRAAMAFGRHPTGIELRRSDEKYWSEGMAAFQLEVLQDIQPINREAVVHLKTHS